MNIKELASHIDHTVLGVCTTEAQVRQAVRTAVRYGAASVCIPPVWVRAAADEAAGRVPVCTVIGVPNGYQTTAVKCYEARQAIADGASEIDMVICLGPVKEGRFDLVEEEIRAVREATRGRILKVIIETCLLNEEEKIALCHAVSRAGADFIKTSTGFSTGGATEEDVALLRRHVAPEVRVKAAGGIATEEQAEQMCRAGADRIGSSRILRDPGQNP